MKNTPFNPVPVAVLSLLAGLLLNTPAAASVRISGVEFAPSVAVGDADVPLRGGGLFPYAVVFRIYAGAL